MTQIIFYGFFFGLIIYVFTLIASKKNGQFYMAPLVTFIAALLITAYGLLKVGGFEGMAYGFLGVCFIIVAIVGVLILPFIAKKLNGKQLNKVDKSLLVILPIIFLATVGMIGYSEDGYWVIDKGAVIINNDQPESYYNVTTISEGAKQVHIQLGEKYAGKWIELQKVKKIGNTEVILKIVDEVDNNKQPFITIGLDEINEPLKIETTDGEEINLIR